MARKRPPNRRSRSVNVATQLRLGSDERLLGVTGGVSLGARGGGGGAAAPLGIEIQTGAIVDLSMPGMTQADYARHARVTRQAVSKMAAQGRLVLDADGRIDAAATDVARGQAMARLNEIASQPIEPIDAPPTAPTVSPSLTKARTETEEIKAKIAKLEYEKRLGRLVETSQIASAASTCAETIVGVIRSLTNHAERIASAAANGGPSAVRTVLRQVAREQRQSAANAFAVMARDAAASGDAAAPQADDAVVDDDAIADDDEEVAA